MKKEKAAHQYRTSDKSEVNNAVQSFRTSHSDSFQRACTPWRRPWRYHDWRLLLRLHPDCLVNHWWRWRLQRPYIYFHLSRYKFVSLAQAPAPSNWAIPGPASPLSIPIYPRSYTVSCQDWHLHVSIRLLGHNQIFRCQIRWVQKRWCVLFNHLLCFKNIWSCHQIRQGIVSDWAVATCLFMV